LHLSSYLKCQYFFAQYLDKNKEYRILEIGSKQYHKQKSYKDFISSHWEYVGLDLESGPNVDIVPQNSYLWREIETESFDVCISGQTFEHNPYFWITFAEIARVLKPNGIAFIVAPGGGFVHRYPYDCWRFFPDSWLALSHYCGMTLVESFFENNAFRTVLKGANWNDSSAIARKPSFASAAERESFHERLACIARTLPSSPLPTLPESPAPCFEKYQAETKSTFFRSLVVRLARFAKPKTIFRKVFVDH
jgi:SAM-dependent methyltransferase